MVLSAFFVIFFIFLFFFSMWAFFLFILKKEKLFHVMDNERRESYWYFVFSVFLLFLLVDFSDTKVRDDFGDTVFLIFCLVIIGVVRCRVLLKKIKGVM